MTAPGSRRDPTPALSELMGIVDALRTHCGWTARLTPATLAPYLVEEAAEVSETIRSERLGEELASELGDVLFQLLLHARLGEERGDLDLTDIIRALSSKLLRRNTHVFAPDGTVLEHPDHDPAAAERAWREAKAAERAGRGEETAGSDPLRGLPRTLPALVLAQKALGRAGAPGPAAEDVVDDGVADDAASATGDGSPSASERIGDALLDAVVRARADGVDAERALRDALERRLRDHPGGTPGADVGRLEPKRARMPRHPL